MATHDQEPDGLRIMANRDDADHIRPALDKLLARAAEAYQRDRAARERRSA